MKSFEDFYKEKYIFKIHTFSNSGATDYGVSIILSDYNELPNNVFRPYKFDKLLFSKKVADLSEIEFLEFSEFLKSEYKSFCTEIEKRINEETDFNNFISENENKLIDIIPFSFTDHYDVYYLNCIDEKIIKQSGKKAIKNIADYQKLDKSEKYYLIQMVVNQMNSIETWH
jgi:hypothetical protein